MSDYNCDLCGTYVDSYQLEKWLHSSDKVLCKKCEKEEKIRRKIDERFTISILEDNNISKLSNINSMVEEGLEKAVKKANPQVYKAIKRGEELGEKHTIEVQEKEEETIFLLDNKPIFKYSTEIEFDGYTSKGTIKGEILV